MKNLRTVILCSLIFVSTMFSKSVFASGIDYIRNEFIGCCKKFKYNDKIVKKLIMLFVTKTTLIRLKNLL